MRVVIQRQCRKRWKARTVEEGDRDPEMDAAPLVTIEIPDGRGVATSRWEDVAHQDTGRRQQDEPGKSEEIDDEIDVGSLHDPIPMKPTRFRSKDSDFLDAVFVCLTGTANQLTCGIRRPAPVRLPRIPECGNFLRHHPGSRMLIGVVSEVTRCFSHLLQ